MNILLQSLAAAGIAGAGPNPASTSKKSAVKMVNKAVGESFILVYSSLPHSSPEHPCKLP